MNHNIKNCPMKPRISNCNLQICEMCKQCKKEWIPAIHAHRKIIHYKKGQLLFQENEPVNGMFFIQEGLVKVHKYWNEEKELILRFANAGAIVGHRGLGSDTIYPVSATALLPTSVCFVELDFFIATLKVNPDYLFNLMLFFAAELKESEKRMRNLAHMSTKGRIADALIRLQEKFGLDELGYIKLNLSRHDMAAYTGTTYETLFKMMNELAEEGIIEINSKLIRIIDPKKLSQCIK